MIEKLSVSRDGDLALAQGLLQTQDKTPEATVAAQLYTDIKKHGDKSQFVQVGRAADRYRETLSQRRAIMLSHR